MADHKFVYTVSGVELSETHKARISQAIVAAVTQALIGDSAPELRHESLTLHRIYGGLWTPVALAEKHGGIVAMENAIHGER